jgi:RND family efflux transporter MFP subunit
VSAKVNTAQAALAQSKAALAQAQADVVAAEADVDVATADVDRTMSLVEYMQITSPFNGVITKRHVHKGHLTVPGGTGDPLFTVERIDRVRVAVGVPEVDAALVNAGDKAEVRLQALDGRIFEGKVARISWSLDESTRTLRVEIDLENPDGVLRPGLYAYVSIVADERADALCLPIASIVRDDGKVFCVLIENGKAVRRPVKTGLSDGQKVEILAGVKEGDAIVSANGASIRDGQIVRIQGTAAK